MSSLSDNSRSNSAEESLVGSSGPATSIVATETGFAASSVGSTTSSQSSLGSSVSRLSSEQFTPVSTAHVDEQGNSSADMDLDDSTPVVGASVTPVGHTSTLAESIAAHVTSVSGLTAQLVVLDARMNEPHLSVTAKNDLVGEYQAVQRRLNLLTSTLVGLRNANLAPVDVFVPHQAAVVHSNVCPTNLPFFQWENSEVISKSAQVFVDVMNCLQKFEDVMFQHNLDFNMNFLRLVPPMLSTSQRLWYKSFIAPFDLSRRRPSWNDFKEAITARYGRTAEADRAECALALVNMSVRSGESLDSFITRVDGLRRRAVDQTLPASVLVTKFVSALPPYLKDRVLTSKASMPPAEANNVDLIMALSQKLYNALYVAPTSVSAPASSLAFGACARVASGDTGSSTSVAVASGSGLHHSSNKSKWASGNKTSHRVSKKNSANGIWCKFHKVNTHNTNECKAFSKANADLVGAADFASSTTRAGGKKKWVPKGSCFKCGAPGYSPQHVCNSAIPSESLGSTSHTFRMMRISPAAPAGPSTAAINVANNTVTTDVVIDEPDDITISAFGHSNTESNVSNTSATAIGDNATSVLDDAMDIDADIAKLAQECKYTEFSRYPMQITNTILLPVIVENHATYAMYDNGSTFSIIHPLFLKSLGVTMTPASGKIQLGHAGSIIDRLGYVHLRLFYNKRFVTAKFEVLDFFKSNDGPFIVVGNDLAPSVGIAIAGLVASWFDYTGPKVPTPIDPDEIQPNNSPVGSEDDRREMLAKLQPLFDANTNIDSKSTYCNLEGAIVKLDTIPNKTAYRKPYPVPLAYKEAVMNQLEAWKDDGVIEIAQSFSGFNAPLLVVSKKDSDGTYSYKKPRVVADVRQLNSILVSTDKYNIPLISDIHQRYSNADIITCIDIKSCFTSFLVDPADKHKLAFTCPFTNVQYVFRKVCFGITFMGNLVQRVLTTLFRDLPYVSVYIDDIGVTTKGSLAYHVDCVAEVLRRLTNANLKIAPEKIVLAQKSVHILGWSIVQGKLMPDPRKVSNVHTWPLPQTGKDVMRYMGFFNYFRSAIPGYSTLAAPLDELRSYKSLVNVWSDSHTESFRKLQTALASAPVISPIDFSYRIHVATDASNTGIGGIVYYIKDSTIHYVAMASRKLSKSEMAYSTTKKECLGIVYMLTKFHKWLFGIHFTLHTDHKSLVFLASQSTPNFMMLNWYEVIFSYSFDIVHIPGITNIIPDALSRLFSSDDDDNNLEGGKFYKPDNNKKDKKKHFSRSLRKQNAKNGHLQSRKQLFTKRINKNNVDTAFVYSTFPTKVSQYHNNDINDDNSDINNKTTSFNSSSIDNTPRVFAAMQYADYMTPPENERLEIISRAHLLGHVGVNAIEKTIHNDYKLHWTNMRNDIQMVVNDCSACQAYNIAKVGYHPPRSVVPDGVFDHICIDLGDFNTTSSSGNNYMLVVVDYFSRYTILRALPDKQSITIAKELLKIFCSYGYVRKITCDRGQEFINEVVTQFVKMSGIDRRLSLPYTPQGNSVVESYVGICKRSIIKSLAADAVEPDQWDLYLDAIQYSINCQYTRLHKSRPFTVMFNRQPNDFIDYTEQVDSTIDIEKSDTKLINQKLKYVKEVVIPSIAKRIQETQSIDHENFKKSHKIVDKKYSINSKVMIINVRRKSKLEPRYLGPFIVKGYTNNGSYILTDLTGDLLSRDIATHHIKLIQDGDQISPNQLKDNHYEVQAIVNHRKESNGDLKYLVNWVGYEDPKYNTWEPVSSFDSKQPITDYWARRNATTGKPLPKTVNKRKIPARNKHSKSFTPVRYSTRSNTIRKQ